MESWVFRIRVCFSGSLEQLLICDFNVLCLCCVLKYEDLENDLSGLCILYSKYGMFVKYHCLYRRS